jgi:hypothetical protein
MSLRREETQLLATEEWRTIAEAPDYVVSNLGRVKRVKADRCGRGEGRLLRTPVSDKGYPACLLYVDGRQLHRLVYKLVCTAFRGPKPSPKHEVRHLDGNRLNTAETNLAWGTSAENKADCRRHGTMLIGERSPHAKLTEEAVAHIRSSRGHYRSLASAYGVSPHHIHRVRRAEQWRHLDG